MTEQLYTRTEHSPGGKTLLPMLSGCRGYAGFSEDRVYRYWLVREWQRLTPAEMKFNWNHCPDCARANELHQPNPHKQWPPYLLSVGMNPSTADYYVDDPTIRRDIELAKREGFECLVKCNVMDYRTTYPSRLLDRGVAPCSEQNLRELGWHASKAAKVVVCWGKIPKPLLEHVINAIEILSSKQKLWCLGLNRDGSPKHPLYLRSDTPLERFPIA